jgi:thymidylate kinase
MIIVLEGVDCCYKSTVANKLKEKLNFEVIQGSSFAQARCSRGELFSKFLKMVIGKTDLIIDRYIYSNICYAPLYKDFAMINESQKKLIESLMTIEQVKVFYLYADADTIKKRIKVRGDEYVKSDQIEQILNQYNSVWDSTEYQINKINTANQTSNEIVEDILNKIK